MAKANMNELQRKALLFMKQGNLKKSLKTVDLAIKTNNKIAINFYIQGRIFQELMDFQSSILAYRKYLSLEKNVVESEYIEKPNLTYHMLFYSSKF